MFRLPSFRRRVGRKPEACPNCGAEISGDWGFCPNCGANLQNDEGGDESTIMPGFGLFADLDKQLEEMDRFFGGRSSVFEIPKAAQRRPQKTLPGQGIRVRGGGISIIFSGTTGRPPKVTIHTSGDFKPLEPELRKKFGAEEGESRQRTEASQRRQEEPARAPPEVTEEPEAELVKGAGGKISALKVKLPDIESPRDIKISRLENSIEIKAYVRNKAYFKLFQVPPTSRITGTGFKNGVLTINFE